MNEIQKAAFESANSGVTAFAPETLAALILGILATVVMLWLAGCAWGPTGHPPKPELTMWAVRYCAGCLSW